MGCQASDRADTHLPKGRIDMKQLSVMVRRDRAPIVHRAFERAAIDRVGMWPIAATGLGPAPQLQHRGSFHDDDRCLQLEAIVSDAQAEEVEELISTWFGPQEYLLWSRQLDEKDASATPPPRLAPAGSATR